MKRIIPIITLVLIMFSASVKAQETVMDEINYSQLERLIQMAKDYYPQRKILEEEELKAKNDVTMAKIEYLDLFRANYFYRPDERRTLNPENPYVTNGYQVSASLNLGTFLQKPFRAKSAKADLKIIQLEKQVYDAELEKEVKTRYYNYVLQLKELKLKTADEQDVLANFQNISRQFEKGEITLEEYNSARTAASGVGSTKMQTEINFLQAKDDLEEIIGTKLADIKIN